MVIGPFARTHCHNRGSGRGDSNCRLQRSSSVAIDGDAALGHDHSRECEHDCKCADTRHGNPPMLIGWVTDDAPHQLHMKLVSQCEAQLAVDGPAKLVAGSMPKVVGNCNCQIANLLNYSLSTSPNNTLTIN